MESYPDMLRRIADALDKDFDGASLNTIRELAVVIQGVVNEYGRCKSWGPGGAP